MNSNFTELDLCRRDAGGGVDFVIDDAPIEELFPRRNLTREKFTCQLSDHLPIWTQMQVDYRRLPAGADRSEGEEVRCSEIKSEIHRLTPALRSARHAACFRRRLSAHRAGAAQHSAVAELGVGVISRLPK